MADIIYIGIFLTEDSRKKLLREITPLHSGVFADHVTLAFKPDLELISLFKPYIGLEIPFRTLTEYCDLKGQCISVQIGLSLPLPIEDKIKHITVSTAIGVPPKYSNELLSKSNNYLPLLPIRLTGIIDYFPRTSMLQGT